MPSSTGTLVFNDQKIQAPDIYATESLGVGISDPTSNLQVVGNAYVTSNLEVGTANLFVDTTTGRVGVGTGSPGYALDVNGGIRTRLPFFWGRLNTQPTDTDSLLVVCNSTITQDTTLGTMYSTTRTCNFPIRGVYVVTVSAHSYYVGGTTYTSTLSWEHKDSNGSNRWATYSNPKVVSQNSGNSDVHVHGTMVFHANAGDYLDVTHGTSVTTYRNYNGLWQNVRAACIYAYN